METEDCHSLVYSPDVHLAETVLDQSQEPETQHISHFNGRNPTSRTFYVLGLHYREVGVCSGKRSWVSNPGPAMWVTGALSSTLTTRVNAHFLKSRSLTSNVSFS